MVLVEKSHFVYTFHSDATDFNVFAEFKDASTSLCNNTTGLRLYEAPCTSILTNEIYILLIGVKVIILVSSYGVLFGATAIKILT